MPLRSLRRSHRLPHRVFATVVAVSLLTMPVTYRGGAEAAHAHTILQLWEDARSGSFAHHPVEPGDAEAAPPSTDDERHAEAPGVGAAGERVSRSPAAAGHGVDGHPAPSGHASTADRVDVRSRGPVEGSPAGTTATMRELGEDGPVAGSAFTPNVRATVLVLPAAAALPLAQPFDSPVDESRRMDGIAVSPTAPPPRQAT